MKRFIQFAMRLILAGIALLGFLNTFFSWVVDRNPGKTTVHTHENYDTYNGVPDITHSVNTATEITSYNLFELSVETGGVIAIVFLAITFFIFKDGFKAWSSSNISMILGGFAVAAGAGIYALFHVTDWVSYMDIGEFSPSVGISCYINVVLSIIGFITIVVVKLISDKFDTTGEEKKV